MHTGIGVQAGEQPASQGKQMADNPVIGAVAQGVQTEFKRLGYRLVLDLSPDAVDCHCLYEPSSAGVPMTGDELQGYLLQAKIVEGVDEEAVAALLNAAAGRTRIGNHLLAHGVPMIPGDDGKIVLAVADSLGSHGADDGCPEATVDFRLVQEFLNVVDGQLVGTVSLPGDGTPGRTVCGGQIPATAGLPILPVLGQNVRLSEDGFSIYAAADGRVHLCGSEVSVENVLTVKGDVDFRVGNIVFNGFVDIKGDVLDDFSVRATKGIKVLGNIGKCHLESGGEVSFCGMSGQGKGSIIAGGNIVANFINEVSIECAGDVLVETEIRSCLIRCLGCIRVNKGGLAGGEYFALGGIESSIIGSVMSLPTQVAAGVNYRDQEELNALFNELKELINRFNANKANIDPKAFMQERTAITERIQQTRSRKYPTRNPKVNAKKIIHERVNITLNTVSEDVREERVGPLSIIENTIEGGFRYLNLTDLSVRSEDIERAFVQQHEFQTWEKEERH